MTYSISEKRCEPKSSALIDLPSKKYIEKHSSAFHLKSQYLYCFVVVLFTCNAYYIMAQPNEVEIESDLEAFEASSSQTTAATPVGSEEEHAPYPEADKSMCAWLFDTITIRAWNLDADARIPESISKLSEQHVTAPFFVTWMKRDLSSGAYKLRGCIGTQRPLPIKRLRDYAILSAFEDTRFMPVEAYEISRLKCHVSILHTFEQARDPYDWIVGLHGITINFTVHGRPYSATYLPEVAKEMGMDKRECLISLINKAGYHNSISDDFINHLQLTRYQSSQARLSYDEYVENFGDIRSRISQ